MTPPHPALPPRGLHGAWDRAGLALLAALALAAVLTFADYGVAWDDPGLRTYGRLLLDFYRSGLADTSFTRFADLAYYGGAFELLWALLDPLVPGDPLVARHLACAAVGLAGIAVTRAIARRIAGPRAGLLAALLLALTPDWYGHLFVNAKDVPFATAMALALLVVCRLLEEWPRPRVTTTLALGLATGLALGVRIGGLAAPLPLLPTLLLLTLRAAREVGPRPALAAAAVGAWRLLPALPVAVGLTLLTWPWVGLGFDHFFEALRHFTALDFPAPVLFEGAVVPATAAPRRYLPELLALKLPEILLLGLALLTLRCRRRPADPRLLAVGTAALWPILHAVLAAPTEFDGIRHHLFVLPPLAVLAAIGLERVWCAATLPRRRALAGVVIVGAGLAAARLAATHPYEYVAFNGLAGGTAGAEGRFELDYWGLSLREVARQAAEELAREGLADPRRPWQVAVCGEPETIAPVLPPFLELVDTVDHADLVIAIAKPGCPATPPEQRLAESRRDGALLSFAAVRSARLAAARQGVLATLSSGGAPP
ncbi:MAG: hypothetical protein KatS3mg117_1749 [Geminicoccaceae bacterium]|nr:MAG: hypothetical protein KatS3mg117_1749 [Geminicoccaceae bacterium]